MPRKLSNKENEVLKIVSRETLKSINEKNTDFSGVDAFTLSLDINSDRANLSRTLNLLSRDGYLIKLLGRPTTFISRRELEQVYPNTFFPEIIDKKTGIKSLISNDRIKLNNEDDPFSHIIGHNQNESLGEVISQIKTSIDYPPEGLPFILFGEAFTGKRNLIQAAIQYSIQKKILKNTKHVYWIDCLNINNENEIFNLINKFVKNDKDFKFIVLQDFDILSDNSRQRLKSIIINKAIYDYDSQNIYPLKSLLILLTQKDLEFLHQYHFEQIIPTILKMPNYDDRSLKERITFILYIFLNEAKNINRSIRISRNILNCFALSSFPGNLDHLKIEIVNSILSYIDNQKNDSHIIDLDFENLSDHLLTRIVDVNNKIQELENLYDIFKISNIILSPNSECLELRTLQQQEIFTFNDSIIIKKNSNKENSIQSMTALCQQSILEAEKVKFDTLRSKTVSDLYDLITDDLKDTSLTNNDHLYYGLLRHINLVVANVKAKTYTTIYNDDFPISDVLIIDLANRIANKIEHYFEIVLPKQEIRFMMVYLSLAKQQIDDCRISILVMCRLARVSESYTKFIKALSNQVIAEKFDYNFFDFALKKEEFVANLQSKINELNSGKGLLIISDELIPHEVEKSIHEITENCLLIPHITVSKLERIVTACQDQHLFLDDFLPYIEESKEVENVIESDSFDIMDLIQNELLGKSLTFLNPQKISELSFEVLAKIIKNLDIAYSDILAIRFVSHTAYMCERVIRGDLLVHKKMNDFINQNGKYLHIIENQFSIINDAFGIIIPQSELIYLTELFLDFM